MIDNDFDVFSLIELWKKNHDFQFEHFAFYNIILAQQKCTTFILRVIFFFFLFWSILIIERNPVWFSLSLATEKSYIALLCVRSNIMFIHLSFSHFDIYIELVCGYGLISKHEVNQSIWANE